MILRITVIWSFHYILSHHLAIQDPYITLLMPLRVQSMIEKFYIEK